MYNDICDLPSSASRESVWRGKLKSSICCFRTTEEAAAVVDPLDEMKSRSPRSPSMIRGKCRNLIARIGKGGRKHYNSSDFSYDPMSYALNFEDESSRADEIPFIGFSSRLPATPERMSAIRSLMTRMVPIGTELFAYS